MSVDSWSSPSADSQNFLKFAHFSNSLDLLHGQITYFCLLFELPCFTLDVCAFFICVLLPFSFLLFSFSKCILRSFVPLVFHIPFIFLPFLRHSLTIFLPFLRHSLDSFAPLFLRISFIFQIRLRSSNIFLFPRPFFSLYFFCKFYYK